MKIVTWNCNMAFRKKAAFILPYKPDILIVPECEHLDKLEFAFGNEVPADQLWYGANKNKGLGVFSYGNYRLRLLDSHNPEIKTILPIAVSGGKFDFTLFAIWANNPQDPDNQYVGQLWKAVHFYKDHIKNQKTILAGDFNSNVIWDKKHRQGTHSALVQHLEKLDIHSTYHLYFKQLQGKELHPTLFMYRHRNKPYHIDYCFASADFISTMQVVDIGVYEEWTQHSDHKPLTVTFNT